MKEQEIYKVFANLLIDSIQQIRFQKAWINIEYASDVSSIDGEYIDGLGILKDLNLETEIQHFDAVANLKLFTQSHPLQHKNWNRAKFTLYPNGKFDIEYIWDQELQDQVDKYNKEN